MKTILLNLKTFGELLLHKAVALVALTLLMWAYSSIPPVTYDQFGNKSGGMPFADLLFVSIIVLGMTTCAPFVRMLIWPETARYAESGDLVLDLDRPTLSNKYLHYRLATVISYALTIVAFAAIAR